MGRLATIKTLAGFDFSFQPSLDRDRILALAQLGFVTRGEVVHFLGPPGTGKSHLAIALGVEAVKAGRSVYFCTLAELIAGLAQAEREGRLRERLRFFCRPDRAARSPSTPRRRLPDRGIQLPATPTRRVEQEGDRPAVAVGQRVDLGRAPTARAADGLIALPPFPPEAERCAFTADESMSTWAGGPPAFARAWKRSTQTPLAAQRT
jgi:hypothetical protein